MKIIQVCHNALCGHKEENENVRYCPVCGDELVRVVLEEGDENSYE